MANRIQIRRDTQQNWENTNPVLADGEIVLNYDTNQLKIGDGSSDWYSLPYANSGFNPSSLAAVASSGSYTDLSNSPLPASYDSTNEGQFLRLNTNTGHYDLAAGFRITNAANVVFPSGTIGQDKAGDVAFSSNALYYCIQEPNSYTVHNGSGQGYNPVGWIRIDNMYGQPDSLRPVIGTKLTDGTTTSTVAEIVAGWGQYGMVVRMDPAVQSWHDTACDLTAFTGDSPHSGANWSKLGVGIVSAPAHNNSPGVLGQIAYDSSYMYRCTQTNVTEISSVYTTPRSTNTPGYPGGNQNGGDTTMNVMDAGGVPAPQNGWILSDGSSTRTITNVVRQNSAWGYIYTLSFTGSIDWTALDSITIISVQGVQAVWKRVALSADTW